MKFFIKRSGSIIIKIYPEYKRNLLLDLKPLKQTNNQENYLLTPLPLLLPNFL